MRAPKGLALPIALVALWQIGATCSAFKATRCRRLRHRARARRGLADGSLITATARTLAAAGGGLVLGARSASAAAWCSA